MRKTSAAQVAASRRNLEKARKAKSAKAGQRRMPTSKEMTKWSTSTRLVQGHRGMREVTKQPLLRSGAKVVAFFPHKGVKYLETKTQNQLIDFMKANKYPKHDERMQRAELRSYLKRRLEKPRKARKVQKVLVKRPVK
jgi:hypothetical protein